MRILIANDNKNAHSFIRSAFSKALAVSGHETILWNTWQKPVYDAFDEANPDLFFGQGYNLTPAFVKCIEERPDMSLVLRVSDWSKFNDELDKTVYPVLTASKKEIQFMKHIQTLPNKLVVHTHHCKEYLEQTHRRWIENGFNLYAFENFGDIFEYTNGKYVEEYKCDLVYLSGYWSYKAKTIDKYILPLCNPNKNYNIRIFGNSPTPSSKYCGQLNENNVKDICKSAKINLSCHEPHSLDFGYDATTKYVNLALNKSFFISDYVEGEKNRLVDGIFCKTPEEYFNQIDYFLTQKQRRQDIVNILYNITLTNHTAFERMIDIFNQLNLPIRELQDGKKLVIKKKNL